MVSLHPAQLEYYFFANAIEYMYIYKTYVFFLKMNPCELRNVRNGIGAELDTRDFLIFTRLPIAITGTA